MRVFLTGFVIPAMAVVAVLMMLQNRVSLDMTERFLVGLGAILAALVLSVYLDRGKI
jgi:chromate transport protein ChrA